MKNEMHAFNVSLWPPQTTSDRRRAELYLGRGGIGTCPPLGTEGALLHRPPLADPAGRFGGGANWSDLSNLTYPQIRVSPRISATLF